MEENFKKEYIYEVVVYRIYKDLIETIECKFYKSNKPFNGNFTNAIKLKNYILMKCVIEHGNN